MSQERSQATEEMRIDDLARAAGVASTTIRLYQSKGLLAPPRLVGRTGYYDDTHLDRLRVIARLQDDGFSLAGIAALLERWDDGRGLSDLLGERATRSQVFALEELAGRFPPDVAWAENLPRAADLGLIEAAEDGRIRVLDARFVETGAALAHLGVPLGAILHEWEQLSRMTDEMAERFAALFETHLVADDWRESLDDAEIARLSAVLDQLRTSAESVVLAALDDSILRVADRRFADLRAGQ